MTRRLEIGLLVALCFFLPLYEAPKSIFWVLYVLTWLANRVRAGDFGGRWDLWDTLIAAWIASGFVVAAFAGLHGDEWRGALDLLRYASVLWVVKRSRFTAREIYWVLGALIVSTVVGLVTGYEAWANKVNSLQLNSVGHVNHTAIYLAIMLGVCASWTFGGWRVLAIAVSAFVLLSLFLTASRGALGVGFIMLVVLGFAWWRRSRAPLAVTLAVIIVTAATAWVGTVEVIRKQEQYVEQGDVLASRGSVWRIALAAWERYPLAGVGMDNYNLVTFEHVRAWRAEKGKDYDPRLYARFGHGHSLYLNTLAERGVIGLVPLLAVLAAWLVFLVRFRPRRDTPGLDWLLWGSAAAAWIVTVGVGFVNTTLHHEHGILAVLLLGLWLSQLHKKR